MKPIGNGVLFERDAKTTFLTLTSQRCHAMRHRVEKKGMVLPCTLPELRMHVLRLLRGMFDGAICCPYCHQVTDFAGAALDHIIPLSRGGSPGLENIDLICAPCNDRKGDLTPAEFRSLLVFLDRADMAYARILILKRLESSIKLAAGNRANMAKIAKLEKTVAWPRTPRRKRPQSVGLPEEF